jgi:hypothetical protein
VVCDGDRFDAVAALTQVHHPFTFLGPIPLHLTPEPSDGVATLAGTSFGPGGEGFLRLSYANSLENIEKALGMIENVLQRVS